MTKSLRSSGGGANASFNAHDSGVSGDHFLTLLGLRCDLRLCPCSQATHPQDSVNWSISFYESLSV